MEVAQHDLCAGLGAAGLIARRWAGQIQVSPCKGVNSTGSLRPCKLATNWVCNPADFAITWQNTKLTARLFAQGLQMI